MAAKKPYTQMTTRELQEETRQFDSPAYHPPALPWGPKQRREQQMANKLARSMKGGRPRIGLGSERIQIAMERGLRQAVDAYARRHKISRSRLLAEAVKRYIAA